MQITFYNLILKLSIDNVKSNCLSRNPILASDQGGNEDEILLTINLLQLEEINDNVFGYCWWLWGPRTTKRYMHVLFDHFTRYTFILTSQGQSANDFIKLIKTVPETSCIGMLLTDQRGD